MSIAASSGDAASPAKGDPAVKAAPSPETAVVKAATSAAAHTGRLYLDQVAEEGWQLSDRTTNEAQVFHASSAELVFDDDGRAAVITLPAGGGGGEATVRTIEDGLMKFDVFVSVDGTVFLGTTSDAHDQLVCLKDYLCKHVVADVTLQLGSIVTTSSLSSFIFKHARGAGCKVFWGMFDWYGTLGLTSYKGQRSKWWYTCSPRWRRYLGAFFDGEFFIGTKHANVQQREDEAVDFTTRMLPQPAMNTVALLNVVARWAFASEERGGLKQTSARKAAMQSLGALLSVAGEAGDFSVAIVCDDAWKCQWPRPHVTYSMSSFSVDIHQARIVTRELGALSGGLRTCPVAKKWRRFLFGPLSPQDAGASSEPLLDFVQKTTCVHGLRSLCAQLLWGIARRLETILIQRGADKEGVAAPSPLQFAVRNQRISVDDPDLDQKLYAYVQSGVHESRRHTSLSLATDKANPCGGALHNTTLTLPNNKTMVDSGFCDDHLDIENERAAEGKGKKRLLDGTFGEGSMLAKRQTAWMRRDEATQDSAWRPVVLHRTSAKKWLVHVDNQISTSTHWAGLGAFCYVADSPVWSPANWRLWPSLTLTMDLGSDGVSAYHSLVHHWGANVWLVPDQSHSAQRSFIAVLKACGVWELWLLMLIGWNLEHGPRLEESRRGQLRAALDKLYTSRVPEETPLFMDLAPRIVADLEEAGVHYFERERPIEQELWAWLSSRNRCAGIGRRTAMNRYGGSLHACMRNLPLWHIQLWERSCLAMEADMLKGGKFLNKLACKATEAESCPEGGAPTDPRRMQLEDRALRGVAQNAVVVSVMCLQQVQHRRVCALVAQVSSPLDAFHTTQNRQLRSTHDALEWITDMACGRYTEHLSAFILLLTDRAALMKCGFEMGAAKDMKVLAGSPDIVNNELGLENEMADLYAQSALTYVAERAKRGQWIYSWPTRMFRVLRSDDLATATIAEFRQACLDFDSLHNTDGKTPYQERLASRHVLTLRCNRRIAEALRHTGDKATAGFKAMLRELGSANLATQIVEDINGLQKNMGNQPNRRFRRPARCMAAALEAEVCSRRHRYDDIPQDVPAGSLSSALPKSVWDPPMKKGSLRFQDIVSTQASPPWWSPAADRMTVPAADLSLLRHCLSDSGLDSVGDSWLGEPCDVQHRMAVGIRRGPLSPHLDWYVCLHFYSDSSVLLWPATLNTDEGTNQHYLDLAPSVPEPVVMPMLSWNADRVLAGTYEWKCWAFQLRVLSEHTLKTLKPGVRAFMNPPKPFIEVATRAAWWHLSRTVVFNFAQHFDIPVPCGATLFDILWSFCVEALMLDDAEALQIVYRRLSYSPQGGGELGDALLGVNEAVEVLDHHDVKHVTQTQQAVRETMAATNVYREEYVARARVVRAAGGKTGAKAKAKPVAKKPLPAHIPQFEAKLFLPPHASIWVSNTRGEWNGHVPPNKRVHEPFTRHGGSQPALKQCLRRLWLQSLEKDGKGVDQCPYQELFG